MATDKIRQIPRKTKLIIKNVFDLATTFWRASTPAVFSDQKLFSSLLISLEIFDSRIMANTIVTKA
jgi:hypothetical protein